MKERILLEGPQGSGKSTQLLNVARWLAEYDIPMYIIDLEDKIEAMLRYEDDPGNISMYVTFEWDDEKHSDETFVGVVNDIVGQASPGDWIAIDRADLAWAMVQRWYTRQKYNEELADRMLKRSKAMKKSSMFTPRFDQGAWQVVNEAYESKIIDILYRSRCNVVFTTGIKGLSDDNPLDIGRLGVLPRGQKEIGHQPHSLFLLGQRKEGGESVWTISTDKDLKGRVYFDGDELNDFALEYLALYYDPEEKPSGGKRK